MAVRSVKKIIYYFFLFALASCANQVPPSGGPKDVTAPKVVKAIPENQSNNFTAHQVMIAFTEYIQLKDLNKQLIISPPFNRDPDVTIKKKSLIISFDDTLKENTTYTMNFGQAIADNNEGNSLNNFQYVFATGNSLDSLDVKGSVVNSFDHKPEKGVLVMLYKSQADSAPYTSRPDYFNRTNDSGQFIITNIAAGDYKIFALKETNSNYLFDSRDESIACMDSAVSIGKTDNIQLDLFREKEKQRISGAFSERPGKAVVTFSQPTRSLKIEPANDSSKISLIEYSPKADTVTLWYENLDLDSLKLFVNEAQMQTDTLTIRLFKKSSKSKKDIRAGLSILSNIVGNTVAELDQPLFLSFSQPLKTADISSVTVTEDSAAAKNISVQLVDSAKRTLKIAPKSTWKEKAHYTIFIPPGAFTDIYDQKNDSFLVSYTTRAIVDYGTLTLKLALPHPGRHYILQLTDDKETIYRQVSVTSDSTLHFDYLAPRTYRLKLIDDVNNNGQWDTGDYMLHLQPEKTMYGSDINVRANWDIDFTWSLH